jgi:protoporphyrinogen oxidase
MIINILGGGISSLSLAYFLQNHSFIKKINILEKEEKIGGLLRSYNIRGLKYDIGPHIIFSKHKEILKKIKGILGKNKLKIRRSNKILYKKDILIKYPFENELSKLPKKDLEFALKNFLNNPYNKIKANNMKNFFLKNFGKGISQLYLEPYNKKIWKFPVSKLDTQMVNRIPKPPRQDVINSAKGIQTEGYTHQLYFYYPKIGGIQSLVESYRKKLKSKVKIFCNVNIKKISYKHNKFVIFYNKKIITSNKLISTIPLNNFCKVFDTTNQIRKLSKDLKYNSIIISIFNLKGNIGGDNFAFMIPDKKIIFHRLSKLDFLGKNYSIKNSTTFEIEITFRKNTNIAKMNNKKLFTEIFKGLKKIGFVKNKKDINFYDIKKFDYAYVIYDLKHRKNVDKLLNYYKKKKITMAGRWGSWEYLNSDQVINQSNNIAENLIKEIKPNIK